MLKHLTLSAGLCCALATSVVGQDTITVVADPWAPFGGADLPNGGISLDVIATVLTEAGYEVDTQILPWERALDGMRDGSYDVIGNLFFNADFESFLSYGDAFYDSEVRFMQRAGAGHSFSDLDSLRPYSIAVGAGYLYEDAFDQADFLNKTEVTTVVQGVRMVATERVDLTLDSIDVLNYVIAQEEPELATLVEVLPTPLATQSIHMAVRRDHPKRDAIVADFNRILAKMRKDGSLDALLAKHQY